MIVSETPPLGDTQVRPLPSNLKAYHSPEFREYGTVGDLTQTSPARDPISYDASYTGYINQTT